VRVLIAALARPFAGYDRVVHLVRLLCLRIGNPLSSTASIVDARSRSIHEAARDKVRAIPKSQIAKKVDMLFTHLKHILRLGRLPCTDQEEAKMNSYWWSAKNLMKPRISSANLY
jgi:hypothetical protein